MNRLKELRKKEGLTLSKLSEMTHIAINTLNQYELGKREPSFDILLLLADTFGVSTDYLMGRKIDDNLLGAQLTRPVVKVPVFGTIPAGIPIEMIEDTFIEDEEEIPAEWLKGGHKFFCLKVRGESMMPRFEDGDTLILKQQEDCENGDYCAVSINHTECTFKKVLKKAEGITLQPLNPAFEPMFFSNKEVKELPITILGVVKEVRRSC